MSKYDYQRTVYMCRDGKGYPVFGVLGEPCPRFFPHTVHGDCETCARQDEKHRRLTAAVWNAARLNYEPVPLKRRIEMACTTFINWIGTWSKN